MNTSFLMTTVLLGVAVFAEFAAGDTNRMLVPGTVHAESGESKGLFNTSYKYISSMPKPRENGLSLLFADSRRNKMIGLQIGLPDGLFIVGGYMPRENFFGLSRGYGDITRFGVEAGSKKLSVKLVHERADGEDIIDEANGTALEVAFRKKFYPVSGMSFDFSMTAQQFLGGDVKTEFGFCHRMEPSEMNLRTNVAIKTKLSNRISFSANAKHDIISGRNARDTKVRTKFSIMMNEFLSFRINTSNHLRGRENRFSANVQIMVRA